MTVYFTCLLQVSTLLALSVLIASVLVHRAPATVARIGTASFLLCVLILLGHAFEMPKPFRVSLESQAAVSNGTEAFNAAEKDEASAPAPLRGLSQGLWFAVQRIPGTTWQDETLSTKRAAALLGWIWMAVAAGVWMRLIFGTFALVRFRHERKPLGDESIRRSLRDVTRQYQLASSPTVYVSNAVQSPCVTWLAKNEIYVPGSFDEWSSSEKRAAVLHELAHDVRNDARTRLLVDVCFALLCWHPIAHMLRRLFVLGQESASDRLAMEYLGAQQNYRESLSRMALRLHEQMDGFSPSLRVSFSNNDLIRRIKMLNSKKSPLQRWQECLLVGVVLTVGGSLSLVSMAADPPERIASLPRGTQPDMEGSFQGKRSQPWDRLGPSDSYFRADVQDFMSNAKLKKSLQRIQALAIKDEMVPSDFALTKEFEVLETNLKLETKRLDGDHPEGKRWSTQAGATAFHLRFGRSLDMGKLANCIRWGLLGPEENQATMWLRDTMQSAGVGQFIVLGECKEATDPDRAKRMWKLVDGGSLGAVTRVDSSLQAMTPQERAEEDPFGLLDTFAESESIALGVDVRPNSKRWAIRIAILPNSDSALDEMKQKWTMLQGDFENMTEGLLQRVGEDISDLSGDERAILDFIETSRVRLVDLPSADQSDSASGNSETPSATTLPAKSQRVLMIEGRLNSEMLLTELGN